MVKKTYTHTHMHSFMCAHPADPRVQVKKLEHLLWKGARQLGMRAVESTRLNFANKTNQHLTILTETFALR